jgi:hypothetical protein
MANVFDDKEKDKNDLLFGGSPQEAIKQAMLASGRNPFRSNPFTEALLRTGPGLQLAAYQKGLGSGMSADEIANQGGQAGLVKQFMMDALKGGNVYGSLRNAASGMRGSLDQVTGIQNALAAGTMTAEDVNPFAELLANTFKNPEGFQGAMTSLMGPLLGNQLGRAYSSQLGDIGTGQLRNQANDGNPESTFWEYMFKNMQPGVAPSPEASVASRADNSLNPSGAPTAGEPGGPPLANGPVLQTGAPDGPVNGPPAPTSGIGAPATGAPVLERAGAEAVQGTGVSPQQVQQVAAQAGISEDSLLRILRDIAMEGGTAAGLPMQAFQGLSTGNIVPNIKASNPYLARLMALAGV